MSRELIFNRVEDYKLGESKLVVYQHDMLLLFDPVDLVNYFYDNRGDSRLLVRRLLDQMTSDASETVLVMEGESGKYIEKRLFTVQGMYQLIFLINTDKTLNMRRNFVNIIEKFRRDHGYTIEKFLQSAYEDNIAPAYSCDRRDRLPEEVIEEFYNIKKQDLFITKVHKFPILNNMIIFDGEPDTEESFKSLRKGFKVDYYLSCTSVIKNLSILLTTDQVSVLIDQLKSNLKAYEIAPFEFESVDDFTPYYKASELLNALQHRMNNIKKGANIMKHLLERLFPKEVSDLLYESVTEYGNVKEDINLELYNKIL